jgi:uncharacterized membrane protein (UPF0127 family)
MHAITIVAIIASIAAGSGITVALFFWPATNTTAESDRLQPEIAVVNNETAPAGSSSSSNDSGYYYQQVNVTVNGVDLVADIAETGEQRSKGLAIKDSLNETEGMLFVFSEPRQYVFWMKDMKFPIDIIWLDSNKTVVHVEHSLDPCGPVSCQTYMPGADSLYVLETVAGFADKYGIVEGMKVKFDLWQ